jgi:hypothetical protein
MLDEIRSVLQQTVAGGAGKLRNVLSLTDASTKLLRFVSDDVWGSKGVCRLVSANRKQMMQHRAMIAKQLHHSSQPVLAHLLLANTAAHP